MKSMMYVGSFLVVFLSTFILINLLCPWSRTRKILHVGTIPVIGGISIGVAFFLVCPLILFFSGTVNRDIVGILVASFLMFLFGIVDDLKEISIPVKLLSQIVATTVLIFFGVHTQIVYIGSVVNVIITFLWVLGITNAFNHLDILDGLAAGTVLIVGIAFVMVSYIKADAAGVILLLCLLGATLSFLMYNLPPARIYMGNAGSHFFGFIFAALALSIHYAPLDRKLALLSPILILGLPIFDTFFLILMRLKQKRLIFHKSNDHLALRFLKNNYSKRKALSYMLGVCLFFSLAGIVVGFVPNFLNLFVLFLVVLLSSIVTVVMGKARFSS